MIGGDARRSRDHKEVDGAVDEGVYPLEESKLEPLKGSGRKRPQVAQATDGGPLLVLGTFVDTVSAFGNLWTQHPEKVRPVCGYRLR